MPTANQQVQETALAANEAVHYISSSDEDRNVIVVDKKQHKKRRVHRTPDIVLSSDEEELIGTEARKITPKQKTVNRVPNAPPDVIIFSEDDESNGPPVGASTKMHTTLRDNTPAVMLESVDNRADGGQPLQICGASEISGKVRDATPEVIPQSDDDQVDSSQSDGGEAPEMQKSGKVRDNTPEVGLLSNNEDVTSPIVKDKVTAYGSQRADSLMEVDGTPDPADTDPTLMRNDCNKAQNLEPLGIRELPVNMLSIALNGFDWSKVEEEERRSTPPDGVSAGEHLAVRAVATMVAIRDEYREGMEDVLGLVEEGLTDAIKIDEQLLQEQDALMMAVDRGTQKWETGLGCRW